MDKRNENIRMRGRHVQSESEQLSKMQKKLIGSEHDRIERIVKEHRRALILQLNGPNPTWSIGKIKAPMEESERRIRRKPMINSKVDSAAINKAKVSNRRDILPIAETRESRGLSVSSQRYIGRTHRRGRSYSIHDTFPGCELKIKRTNTSDNSKSLPVFNKTNEMRSVHNNEYSASSFNKSEQGSDMHGLEAEKCSSLQQSDEKNITERNSETNEKKNNTFNAVEVNTINKNKRGCSINDGHVLDQNHDLVSQGTKSYDLSLPNEMSSLNLKDKILYKVTAHDADWVHASPPLTSIHDKFIKTNRFFAVSRKRSGSNQQISKVTPDTKHEGDIKSTVLSNGGNNDSTSRDSILLTNDELKEQSKVDVPEKVETVTSDRKVTFQDDFNHSEQSVSEVIEGPSSRTHVVHSTESMKKDNKKATTLQPAISTGVNTENCPPETERFLFKAKRVSIPQLTDKHKSERFSPRLCSKNEWAPKVTITCEENEPMKVSILPAEGSMHKRLTLREHEDLWPQVKLIVILRMLDGEHYYKEIKR